MPLDEIEFFLTNEYKDALQKTRQKEWDYLMNKYKSMEINGTMDEGLNLTDLSELMNQPDASQQNTDFSDIDSVSTTNYILTCKAQSKKLNKKNKLSKTSHFKSRKLNNKKNLGEKFEITNVLSKKISQFAPTILSSKLHVDNQEVNNNKKISCIKYEDKNSPEKKAKHHKRNNNSDQVNNILIELKSPGKHITNNDARKKSNSKRRKEKVFYTSEDENYVSLRSRKIKCNTFDEKVQNTKENKPMKIKNLNKQPKHERSVNDIKTYSSSESEDLSTHVTHRKKPKRRTSSLKKKQDTNSGVFKENNMCSDNILNNIKPSSIKDSAKKISASVRIEKRDKIYLAESSENETNYNQNQEKLSYNKSQESNASKNQTIDIEMNLKSGTEKNYSVKFKQNPRASIQLTKNSNAKILQEEISDDEIFFIKKNIHNKSKTSLDKKDSKAKQNEETSDDEIRFVQNTSTNKRKSKDNISNIGQNFEENHIENYSIKVTHKLEDAKISDPKILEEESTDSEIFFVKKNVYSKRKIHLDNQVVDKTSNQDISIKKKKSSDESLNIDKNKPTSGTSEKIENISIKISHMDERVKLHRTDTNKLDSSDDEISFKKLTYKNRKSLFLSQNSRSSVSPKSLKRNGNSSKPSSKNFPAIIIPPQESINKKLSPDKNKKSISKICIDDFDDKIFDSPPKQMKLRSRSPENLSKKNKSGTIKDLSKIYGQKYINRSDVLDNSSLGNSLLKILKMDVKPVLHKIDSNKFDSSDDEISFKKPTYKNQKSLILPKNLRSSVSPKILKINENSLKTSPKNFPAMTNQSQKSINQNLSPNKNKRSMSKVYIDDFDDKIFDSPPKQMTLRSSPENLSKKNKSVTIKDISKIYDENYINRSDVSDNPLLDSPQKQLKKYNIKDLVQKSNKINKQYKKIKDRSLEVIHELENYNTNAFIKPTSQQPQNANMVVKHANKTSKMQKIYQTPIKTKPNFVCSTPLTKGKRLTKNILFDISAIN